MICLVINGLEIIGEYYQTSHHRDRMPIFDDETRSGDEKGRLGPSGAEARAKCEVIGER